MELLLADRDACPWQAGYWYVRDGGFKPRQALQMYRNDDGRIELEPEWEEIRDGLGDTVVALVAAIRRGQFPVCSTDEHCTGHCPYQHHLPHQSGSFLGEDMPADGDRSEARAPGLTDQQHGR